MPKMLRYSLSEEMKNIIITILTDTVLSKVIQTYKIDENYLYIPENRLSDNHIIPNLNAPVNSIVSICKNLNCDNRITQLLPNISVCDEQRCSDRISELIPADKVCTNRISELMESDFFADN